MTLYCALLSYCLWPLLFHQRTGNTDNMLVGDNQWGQLSTEHLDTLRHTGGKKQWENDHFVGEKSNFYLIMWKPAVDKVQILAVNLFPNIGEFNAWSVLYCYVRLMSVHGWVAGGPGYRDTEAAPTLDTALMGWLVGDNNEDTGLLMRDPTFLPIPSEAERLDDKRPCVHITKYLITDCPKFSLLSGWAVVYV